MTGHVSWILIVSFKFEKIEFFSLLKVEKIVQKKLTFDKRNWKSSASKIFKQHFAILLCNSFLTLIFVFKIGYPDQILDFTLQFLDKKLLTEMVKSFRGGKLYKNIVGGDTARGDTCIRCYFVIQILTTAATSATFFNGIFLCMQSLKKRT